MTESINRKTENNKRENIEKKIVIIDLKINNK